MRIMMRCVMAAMVLTALAAPYACGETVTIDELVAQYKHATDVQRTQLDKHFKHATLAVNGMVKNVEPWNVFDERTDTGANYYQVVTEARKTTDGTPYEILVFYKDQAKVRDLNKGQAIQLDGTFLKIIDQRLIYSVWVYGEELGAAEKEIFR